MSHEIETMMFAGETPWHGLGTRVEDKITAADAIVAAGLAWKVELKPLAIKLPGPGAPIVGADVDHRAAVRDSDGRVLGVVGPGYEPLQNVDAFKFFDPFVAAGQATYHTAGSLREGSRVWVLAKIAGDPLVVAGEDAVDAFVLLANGHDGSFACRVGLTPIRVVCNNTLSMAIGHEGSKLIRVRHVGAVADTLSEIRETMDLARRDFVATLDQYQALAARQIDAGDLAKYVRVVFGPKPPRGTDGGGADLAPAPDAGGPVGEPGDEGVAPNTSTVEHGKVALPKIVELFESGPGAALPSARGTWWGAYNAITAYYSWGRGASNNNRMNHVWFNGGVGENRRALRTALAMSSPVAPSPA